jgi:integrase
VAGLSFSVSPANATSDAPPSGRMESDRQDPKVQAANGSRLRLDDAAEQKLLAAANTCHWTTGMYELLWNIIILARDTGMRNQRELYRIRVENLDWDNRIIFVPDSKTAEGRKMIPMSDRVCDVVRERVEAVKDGCFHPSDRTAATSRTWDDRFARHVRRPVFLRTRCCIAAGTTTARGS